MASPSPTACKNRLRGAQFESLLVCRAAVDGMRALKNELSYRYLRGGKILPIKADLDFRILRRDGRIAYIDTKCFDGTGFTYSQIDRNQLRRALCYQEFNVPSGFVVWLRDADCVVFYSAKILWNRGARTRFTMRDGVYLGPGLTFSLARVFPELQVGGVEAGA